MNKIEIKFADNTKIEYEYKKVYSRFDRFKMYHDIAFSIMLDGKGKTEIISLKIGKKEKTRIKKFIAKLTKEFEFAYGD